MAPKVRRNLGFQHDEADEEEDTVVALLFESAEDDDEGEDDDEDEDASKNDGYRCCLTKTRVGLLDRPSPNCGACVRGNNKQW